MNQWKTKPKRIEAYEVDENGDIIRLVLLNEGQELPENTILKEDIYNG